MANLDVVGQRSETVRRWNLSAIVRELHVHGPLSRSELVARTGLTRSAIRGLVAELVTAGLAAEARAVPGGSPGRPSAVVRTNPERATALALEIAVDSIAAARVGLGGVVLKRVRVGRPRGKTSVAATVADLARLADRVRGGSDPDAAVVGVGVAVVGVVRRTDGLVSVAPNLGWRDVPLGERLAHALGLSLPVAIANEADLGALAEVRRGAAVGERDVVFLSGEVGVGAGLIVRGVPLTGSAGYAGEVGHMPVNPDGRACRCGATGCWETEVGEDALLRRAGQRRKGGPAGVNSVIEDAVRGDPIALTAIAETGRWLGIGLAGLVNVLNPRLIVLGGMFGRLYPFVRDALDAELDRRALSAPRGLVRVAPAALGLDAPLLGAAELAFEPLLADPAAWIGPRERLVDLESA